MKERQVFIKDSVPLILLLPSFAQHIREGTMHRGIGVVGGQNWFVELTKEIEDDVEYLSVCLYYLPYFTEPFEPKAVTAAITFSIENENPYYNVHGDCGYDIEIPPGDIWGWLRCIELSRVLDENSGFLLRGALQIDVEVRVDVITDNHGIRRLNFHDPFEGCVRFATEYGQQKFYVRKVLLIHHSPVLAEQIAAGKDEFTIFADEDPYGHNFELFLQLLHGVHVKVYNLNTATVIIKYANQFDTQCVIRICERHYCHLFTPYFGIESFLTQCHIKRKLSTVDNLGELKQLAIQYPEHINDTETMKRAVSKFFSFAVDFREGPEKSQKRRKGFFSRVLRRLKKLKK